MLALRFVTNARMLLLWLSAALGGAITAYTAETATRPSQTKLDLFEARYRAAKEQHSRMPSDASIAMTFAAASFDRAELAVDSKERARLAEPAVKVCRQFLNHKGEQSAAHYYLALNLGQLARTKWLGALSIVREMEERLVMALRLNPELDHAGASRALCMLYDQAPGWPTSIGNQEKAMHYAKQAIKIAPRYPGNQLLFVELLARADRPTEAREHLKNLPELINPSRKRLSSEYWKLRWEEWDQRWELLRQTLAEKD